MDMYVVCEDPRPHPLAHKHPPDQMHAALGENSFGWMAMYAWVLLFERPALKLTPRSSGFGDSMTTSQMVIMWPNKDGSVTLSQRTASSHTQPQLDRAPQRIAQTHLAISAVSNCDSYMHKNKPFDPWRIFYFTLSLLSALNYPFAISISNPRTFLAFFYRTTTIPNSQLDNGAHSVRAH